MQRLWATIQGSRKIYLGGWGALVAPFPKPPLEGGSKGRLSFFHVFHAFMTKPLALSQSVTVTVTVTLGGGGGGSSYRCQPF